MSTVMNAFDNNYDTFFRHTSASCFIGYDFGPQWRVNVSRIRVYPQVRQAQLHHNLMPRRAMRRLELACI
jgi:hypothetical protein